MSDKQKNSDCRMTMTVPVESSVKDDCGLNTP